MKKIGKSAMVLMSSKISVYMISLISIMLLSRFRSLEEYGTYSQVLLIVSVGLSLAAVGLPNSINYFYVTANSIEEKNKFLRFYFTLVTIMSLVMGIILMISLPTLSKVMNNELLNEYAYMLLLLPWTQIIISSASNLWIAQNKLSKIFVFTLILNSCTLLSIILTEMLNKDFSFYMRLYLIVQAGFSTYVYFDLNREAGSIIPTLDKTLLKTVLVYSIPLGIGSMLGTLKTETDKIMISYFTTAEEYAIYANAAKELPFTIISTAIIAVLLPEMIRLFKNKENKNAIKIWKESISFTIWMMYFIATVIIVFADQVLIFLYSEKYIEGVQIFRIYTALLFVRVTYYGMVLNAIAKTKELMIIAGVVLILNVICNVIFYYVFGYIGPAISTLIITMISAMLILKVTASNINDKISKIFPWKDAGKILIINCIFAIIFMHIKKFGSIEVHIGEFAEFILLAIIWGVMYFVVTFRFIKEKWMFINNQKSERKSS